MNQKEVTQLMKDMGAARRNARHNYISEAQKHTETDYGAKLVKAMLADIINGLHEDCEIKYAWIDPLKDLGVEFVANVVLRCTIDRMFGEIKYAALVMRCVEALDDSIKVRFIQNNVKYGKETIKTVKRGRKRDDILRGIIANGVRKKKIAFVTYDKKVLACLANAVLWKILLHEYSPLRAFMTIVHSGGGRRKVRKVMMREGVADWVRDCRDQDILFRPFWLPMTEQPRAWENAYTGAYPLEIRQVDFLTNRKEGWVYGQDWDSFEPSAFAATYMQNIPHRVSDDMYAVMVDLYDNRVEFNGFPAWELTPVPQVAREDYTPTTAREIRDIKVFNDKTQREKGKLAVAKRMHEEFQGNDLYLPMKSDYRGRLYTIPFDVTYQGSDMHKGMLSFANGEVSTKSKTKEWLVRQLANSYGWDKKPIHERLKIVDEKREMIARVVANPNDTFREWGEASDPWQFLAACFEWSKFKQSPQTHKHTLPIGMDASCNGLQILSIMACCEVGCYATNVLPSDSPKDFYTTVLKEVNNRLEGRRDSFSKRWLKFGLSRSTVKQPTMTLPYGGTTYSVIEHVSEWYADESLVRTPIFEMHERNKACSHLAKEIVAAIYDCLPNVKWLMEWMREVARCCTDQRKSPEWDSPSGFRILQTYTKDENYRLTAPAEVSLAIKQGKIYPRRHVTGIVPNFIHGIDSAILHELVKKVAVHPVLKNAPLSSVHDCYNTTAPYADMMCQLVRDTFCEVMSDDLLNNFREDIIKLGVKDVPELPIRNKISLREMKNSIYLFS